MADNLPVLLSERVAKPTGSHLARVAGTLPKIAIQQHSWEENEEGRRIQHYVFANPDPDSDIGAIWIQQWIQPGVHFTRDCLNVGFTVGIMPRPGKRAEVLKAYEEQLLHRLCWTKQQADTTDGYRWIAPFGEECAYTFHTRDEFRKIGVEPDRGAVTLMFHTDRRDADSDPEWSIERDRPLRDGETIERGKRMMDILRNTNILSEDPEKRKALLDAVVATCGMVKPFQGENAQITRK